MAQYCLVFEDAFGNINSDIWSFEIQRGGFGTGSFEWTTNDKKNAYVDAEGLHIVPTLTTESTDITLDQMYDGYVLNLTTDGTCTSQDITMCSIRSNKTSGDIINPVRSARLVTRGKKNIKYGKVEVVAKLPQGDWLWPAIWMMPEPVNITGDGAYGPWPCSGEIDLMESRGNNGDDYPDGRDSVFSTLHWGPIPEQDAFSKTTGKHNLRRTDYSENFHTYGLEWRDDILFTYIDTMLLVRLLGSRSVVHADSPNSKYFSSGGTPNTLTCGNVANSVRSSSTVLRFTIHGHKQAKQTRRLTSLFTSF